MSFPLMYFQEKESFYPNEGNISLCHFFVSDLIPDIDFYYNYLIIVVFFFSKMYPSNSV